MPSSSCSSSSLTMHHNKPIDDAPRLISPHPSRASACPARGRRTGFGHVRGLDSGSGWRVPRVCRIASRQHHRQDAAGHRGVLPASLRLPQGDQPNNIRPSSWRCSRAGYEPEIRRRTAQAVCLMTIAASSMTKRQLHPNKSRQTIKQTKYNAFAPVTATVTVIVPVPAAAAVAAAALMPSFLMAASDSVPLNCEPHRNNLFLFNCNRRAQPAPERVMSPALRLW